MNTYKYQEGIDIVIVIPDVFLIPYFQHIVKCAPAVLVCEFWMLFLYFGTLVDQFPPQLV